MLSLTQLKKVFQKFSFDQVIHLASHKSVSESVLKPLKYYNNNLVGTINLVNIMLEYKVNKIVFSSSATVYGDSNKSPINENAFLKPINPYGEIKLLTENFLKNVCSSNSNFSSISLRYFNPVGSHESGLIGEDPKDEPNNIVPIMMRVAAKEQKILNIFGNDYSTKDGTGIRDYIHIMDLAEGHLCALNYIKNLSGHFVFNLGTGSGLSVLELLNAFEKYCDIKIPFQFVKRRFGDVPITYADPAKAFESLNWRAKKDIRDICISSWNYKKNLKN